MLPTDMMLPANTLSTNTLPADTTFDLEESDPEQDMFNLDLEGEEEDLEVTDYEADIDNLEVLTDVCEECN